MKRDKKKRRERKVRAKMLKRREFLKTCREKQLLEAQKAEQIAKETMRLFPVIDVGA